MKTNRPFARASIAFSLFALSCATQHAHAADWRWLNANNQPRPIAIQAAKQLVAADSDGLSPPDYEASKIESALAAASKAPLAPEEAAKLDEQLTQSVLRYANELHHGRIDPKTIRENYTPDARPPFDANALLTQALATGDLQPLWQAATPKAPMYEELRTELLRYLRLRAHPAWGSPLPALPKAATIRPMQEWSGLPLLAQRLAALGYLPASAPQDSRKLTPELQQAISSYQKHHSLKQSGLFDRATSESINITPTERAAQIAQTLERLRWAPLQQAQRMIVVNIPEYRLRAYTLYNYKAIETLPINVIVGRARSNPTPLFNKDMQRVEFSPFWNVPPSILRKEMLPRIQNDPDYIRRGNYEIVGSNGKKVELSPEALAGLANGSMRVRQRPGRGNALGGVKFIFPNNQNIYLHHTSSPGLFKREARAMSHGCVRVEEPKLLAKFVLHDNPEWTEQRISTAIDKHAGGAVQLKQPIPVIITYLTTVIGEDKNLYFLPDVYGQDKLLQRALEKRPK